MCVLIQDVARRYAETMLYWRGHLRAREVRDYLGVSERTARSLIDRWRRAHGILPPYRPAAARCLTPVDGFDPGPEVSDPNVALSLLLMAGCCPGNPFGPVALPEGGHDLALSARLPSGAVRQILSACIQRDPVWLLYAAKTGRQEFVFHPSALVRSRGRYHLRGYRAAGRDAEGRGLAARFVDVVPARAIEARRSEETPFVGLERDGDWHVFEERRFVLSRDLSDDERICYEHEYGIADDGWLLVRHRRALMHYVQEELLERRCWRSDGTVVRVWAGLD